MPIIGRPPQVSVPSDDASPDGERTTMTSVSSTWLRNRVPGLSSISHIPSRSGVAPAQFGFGDLAEAGDGEDVQNLQPLGQLLRSEEHTSELQSRENLVCRLLLEKKKKEDQKHVVGGRNME